MGSCHQSEKMQKPQPQQQLSPHSHQRQRQHPLREKLHQSNLSELNAPEPESLKPIFKDMPEYPGDVYKGYGIKRMKAYKCTLNIKDLTQLRDDFWTSMKAKRPEEWTIMHQACVFDHTKAEIYLSNNNFRTLDGCINTCVDEYNNVYHVPNYCINDPYFEKEIKPVDDAMASTSLIEVNIRDLYLGKATTMKVSLSSSAAELKEAYARAIGCNLDVNSSKLIFGGCVIKNTEFLYQHGIKDGFTLQMMTIKQEETS